MVQYNYSHFKAGYYAHDRFSAPNIGDSAPDFTAYTLEGKKVKLSDYFGAPLVLEMGSITCPVFVGVMSSMKKLQEKFPQVKFLVLYVREAHPGEKRGAHHSNKVKQKRAKECKTLHNDPRTVLVDDVSGRAHKIYGLFPNSTYIIDGGGKIFWRAKWNHPKELQKNLQRLFAKKKATKESSSELPGALSPGAFLKGGWIALWDFVKGFPKLVWLKFIKPR